MSLLEFQMTIIKTIVLWLECSKEHKMKKKRFIISKFDCMIVDRIAEMLLITTNIRRRGVQILGGE